MNVDDLQTENAALRERLSEATRERDAALAKVEELEQTLAALEAC